MVTHPKLKKIVFDKLIEDLSKKEVFPYADELWILDRENFEWYISVSSSGKLTYNQIFFKTYIRLFGLPNRDFDKLLGGWFEKSFCIPIRNVMRQNSSLEYVLVKMFEQNFDRWSIQERRGFSYEIVKRFLGIESVNNNVIVEDFIFL